MNLRNCSRCGKMFNYVAGPPICDVCKKHYYDVSYENREISNYFHCEDPNCKGYVHIQKSIIVE